MINFSIMNPFMWHKTNCAETTKNCSTLSYTLHRGGKQFIYNKLHYDGYGHAGCGISISVFYLIRFYESVFLDLAKTD